MKKIWFVSPYSMPPKYEFRHKTQEIAKRLQNQGYDVTLVSASFLHNHNINLIKDKRKYIKATYDDLKFIHIKTPSYKKTGLKRIYNMLSFGRKLYRLMGEFEVPDIIVADVNCINYKYIAKIAKKYNIRFIVDVRDLWPLSIVEYFNISPSNLVIKYLYKRERDMYYSADKIIFSMEGGKDYISDMGWDKHGKKIIDLEKVFHINNGVDYKKFLSDSLNNKVPDSDLVSSKFKVVYTGSIRKVNNILKIIEAAREVQMRDKNILFLIYGMGDELEALKKYKEDNNLENVLFKGVVNKIEIPYILSASDLNVYHCSHNNLSTYGLSLNKMFDYFASGKPTLTDCRGNYNLIERYNAGIVIDNATEKEWADEIIKIKQMQKEDYNKLCKNAILAANDYDYNNLTKQLIKIIES